MNSPHFKSLDESVTPTPTSLSLREWISLSCAISQVEKSSSGLPFVKENCCVNDTKNEMLEVLGVISVVLLENVVLNGSEKSLENSFCKRVVAHFLTLRPKIDPHGFDFWKYQVVQKMSCWALPGFNHRLLLSAAGCFTEMFNCLAQGHSLSGMFQLWKKKAPAHLVQGRYLT